MCSISHVVEDLFYPCYEQVAFKLMVAEMDVSELHIIPEKEKNSIGKKKIFSPKKLKKRFLSPK